MASRRRKGNKLFAKIIWISLAAHAVALPILAHYGAFKKIQREFMTSTVVVLPPLPKEKDVAKKPAPKKIAAKAKGAKGISKARAKPNTGPKVMAAKGPADASGTPGVDNTGTGKVGQVPVAPRGGGGGGSPVATNPIPPVVTEPTKPSPTPPIIEPKPKADATAVTAPPHQPVFLEAEPAFKPEISIPDDLRADALDKTLVVEMTVRQDGSVGDLVATQSTGSDELDRIGLEAAKKWRFKPRTRDGQPIASKVRLHIAFKVD